MRQRPSYAAGSLTELRPRGLLGATTELGTKVDLKFILCEVDNNWRQPAEGSFRLGFGIKIRPPQPTTGKTKKKYSESN